MKSRSKPGPATLRHHDAVIGDLREADFSIAMAAYVASVRDSYMYGFILCSRRASVVEALGQATSNQGVRQYVTIGGSHFGNNAPSSVDFISLLEDWMERGQAPPDSAETVQMGLPCGGGGYARQLLDTALLEALRRGEVDGRITACVARLAAACQDAHLVPDSTYGSMAPFGWQRGPGFPPDLAAVTTHSSVCGGRVDRLDWTDRKPHVQVVPAWCSISFRGGPPAAEAGR